MKTAFAILAFALAAGPALTPAAHAVVGKTYLTAFDKAKGSQASAGRYGRQIPLETLPTAPAAPAAKDGKKRSSNYNQKVTFCGTSYYTTTRGVAWIDAHRKAGHELVVRKHVGKRKYSTLCGKPPKRSRTARKSAAPKKPAE